MAKVKRGVSKCDCCGEQVVWRESDQGSLSYTCQHCDYRAFAPKFSDAAKAIAAKFAPEPEPVKPATPKPAAKAAPAPKPAEPEAAPKPAPAKGGGSMWDQLLSGGAA